MAIIRSLISCYLAYLKKTGEQAKKDPAEAGSGSHVKGGSDSGVSLG